MLLGVPRMGKLTSSGCLQAWQRSVSQQHSDLHLSVPDAAGDSSTPCCTAHTGLTAASQLGMLKAAASELGPRHALTASCGDASSALSPGQQHSHAAGSLFGVQLRGSVLLEPRLLAEAQPGAAAPVSSAGLTGAPREAGITGGLGALGLLLARWLCRQGCGVLHLLGRSGQADPAALQALLTTQVPPLAHEYGLAVPLHPVA